MQITHQKNKSILGMTKASHEGFWEEPVFCWPKQTVDRKKAMLKASKKHIKQPQELTQ